MWGPKFNISVDYCDGEKNGYFCESFLVAQLMALSWYYGGDIAIPGESEFFVMHHWSWKQKLGNECDPLTDMMDPMAELITGVVGRSQQLNCVAIQFGEIPVVTLFKAFGVKSLRIDFWFVWSSKRTDQSLTTPSKSQKSFLDISKRVLGDSLQFCDEFIVAIIGIFLPILRLSLCQVKYSFLFYYLWFFLHSFDPISKQ